jgi:hypothetical protein
MSAPIPTLDPIKNSNLWAIFVLKGWNSPGSIPKGGVKGFKRETGWDEKKGKGTQGATLTLKSMPPAKGSFTIQLITPQDFADWDAFVANVLSINPAQQQAQGLSIYYPGFSSIGLTTVVVASYSAPEHQGKGLYHVEVHLIEWQQPPATNITSTPSSTATDGSNEPTAPTPVDPRVTARQAQIALLTNAAKAP